MKVETATHELCPLQVEILMHYYGRADGYGGNSPAARSYMEGFVRDGVLGSKTSPWSLTYKGNAWVHAILSTPCPTPAWVLSDGRVLTLPEK